ncbi:MAG: DUF4038 domain-containing protein [Saprospiraceae bacterium]|nr:DUF4038 domain-containing protein [Saprospiraceae bacterium]
MRVLILILCYSICFSCAKKAATIPEVPQWTTSEIVLTSDKGYNNGYVDIDVSATFTNDSGRSLIRPAFWDGDSRWKIRFAPPDTGSIWSWKTKASDPSDMGLDGQHGQLRSVPYEGEDDLIRHGLLQMSPGKRNVMHSEGTPFLVVGDTPWSLPFRATKSQVKTYAEDRQAKGYNCALLMTVQPDMEADGPEARNTDQGFMRGFSDLSSGHINDLKPSYYQYLDTLMDILLEHGIVPVYQPVFHGFGWKGKRTLGKEVGAEEYVRYCRYLLARYGSKPAFWLLAGDNNAKDPGIKESGEMLQKEDCYGQPTGLHYNPCDDYIATWAEKHPQYCNHYNKVHQAESWLDFQWAQTGHGNEHLYHKVERMYDNLPTKASANGEPTYEGMNSGQNGLGWWQGEDAWMQLMSGGTMGVVYGAASLWQWKVIPDETGWSTWTNQEKAWYEALKMEGSNYVGLVSKAFEGFDFLDMEKRWDLTAKGQPLLCQGKEFYVSYLSEGGVVTVEQVTSGTPFRWFNPTTGAMGSDQKTESTTYSAPSEEPWVLIIGQKEDSP